MPMMARLESPGSLAHIMARGIEGKDIFNEDSDREKFLALFSVLIKDVGHKCLAWCLMDNHYHVLVRTNENPMSKLMRPLNGTYARWFNDKYHRTGYLFQGRFKSVLCQDMDYAKQLIRYIHLNPVRAGKVPNLDKLKTWRWCGHAYLLNARNAYGEWFHDRREVLRRFGRMESKAIQAYLAYMAEGVSSGNTGILPEVEMTEIMGAQKGWPAVIGDPQFVKQAMERHRIGLHRKHRKADYLPVLARINKEICAEYSLKPNEIMMRGRENARSKARAHFCFRAHHNELIPFAVIARYLRINIPPVSILYRQGRENVSHPN